MSVDDFEKRKLEEGEPAGQEGHDYERLIPDVIFVNGNLSAQQQ